MNSADPAVFSEFFQDSISADIKRFYRNVHCPVTGTARGYHSCLFFFFFFFLSI